MSWNTVEVERNGEIAIVRIAREQRVMYEKRREGVVYDACDYAVALGDTSRVDFWVADALALPCSAS